jgi:hypothetical protein
MLSQVSFFIVLDLFISPMIYAALLGLILYMSILQPSKLFLSYLFYCKGQCTRACGSLVKSDTVSNLGYGWFNLNYGSACYLNVLSSC